MQHVAVVIVGYQNVGDIVQCLRALGASTHADFEVVICENGGEAAFEALKAGVPDKLPGGQPVRAVAAPHNLGYGGGINFAMAACPDADIWWVLNPDTEPDPDAMALQVERLQAGDCDAVGCNVYLPTGKVQSYGGRWRPWLARAVSLGHGEDAHAEPDARGIEAAQRYLNGASMMFGRRFVEVTGPMREEYFLYCEEVEWCLRAIARGLKLGFAPGARVLHHAGTTTGSYDEMRRRPPTPIYLNERNKLLTTRDCFPARLPVAALATLGSLTIRYGRHRAWTQLGYALAGWRAGLANERGVPTKF
jgi:hypothetical protein